MIRIFGIILATLAFFAAPSSAQLPGMQVYPLLNQPLPSVQYCTNASSTSDLTTYTFSSQSLCEPSGSRYIVVGIGGGSNDAGTSTYAINSVTVGGVSASSVVSNKDTNVAPNIAALWIAAVPSGTTGDVVVTFDRASSRAAIGVWALYNLNSATAVGTGGGASSDPQGANVNTSTDGIVIAYGFNSGGGTASWTGVTENFDTTVEAVVTTGGSVANVVAATPRTVSVDWSTGNTRSAASAASWR